MSADTSRYLGYFTAASFLIFLLIVSLVVPVNIAFSSRTVGGEQFPQSITASSSADTTPHSLELRAVQDGDNAEPRKVSGFRLDMTNVVTAQINSQLLVFVTDDNSVQVIEAKIRPVSGQLIDLVPSTTTQTNAFSLSGFPVGVYTLDVITQKGNTEAAYEGILVISQQPTTIINEPTKNVINQEINQNTRVDTDVKVVFRDRDRDGDGDDRCPAGYEGKPPFCTPKDPCIENPNLSQCQVDCEANPDDPRCQVEGGDICDENPDAPECQQGAEEQQGANEQQQQPQQQEQQPLQELLGANEQQGDDEVGGDEGGDGGDEGDTGGGDEGNGGEEQGEAQ